MRKRLGLLLDRSSVFAPACLLTFTVVLCASRATEAQQDNADEEARQAVMDLNDRIFYADDVYRNSKPLPAAFEQAARQAAAPAKANALRAIKRRFEAALKKVFDERSRAFAVHRPCITAVLALDEANDAPPTSEIGRRVSSLRKKVLACKKPSEVREAALSEKVDDLEEIYQEGLAMTQPQ